MSSPKKDAFTLMIDISDVQNCVRTAYESYRRSVLRAKYGLYASPKLHFTLQVLSVPLQKHQDELIDLLRRVFESEAFKGGLWRAWEETMYMNATATRQHNDYVCFPGRHNVIHFAASWTLDNKQGLTAVRTYVYTHIRNVMAHNNYIQKKVDHGAPHDNFVRIAFDDSAGKEVFFYTVPKHSYGSGQLSFHTSIFNTNDLVDLPVSGDTGLDALVSFARKVKNGEKGYETNNDGVLHWFKKKVMEVADKHIFFPRIINLDHTCTECSLCLSYPDQKRKTFLESCRKNNRGVWS